MNFRFEFLLELLMVSEAMLLRLNFFNPWASRCLESGQNTPSSWSVYSCFDKSCPKKRKSVRDNAER